MTFFKVIWRSVGCSRSGAPNSAASGGSRPSCPDAEAEISDRATSDRASLTFVIWRDSRGCADRKRHSAPAAAVSMAQPLISKHRSRSAAPGGSAAAARRCSARGGAAPRDRVRMTAQDARAGARGVAAASESSWSSFRVERVGWVCGAGVRCDIRWGVMGVAGRQKALYYTTVHLTHSSLHM